MPAYTTGQIIVTTAGTPVPGTTIPKSTLQSASSNFLIKMLPANTKNGLIYGLGDDPYIMSLNEKIIYQGDNLDDLFFDMETGGDGEGFCWFRI